MEKLRLNMTMKMIKLKMKIVIVTLLFTVISITRAVKSNDKTQNRNGNKMN